MSANLTNPMDVFSTYMDIPFDVAAYCRGHKFAVEAVALSRAIRARKEAERAVELAEIASDRVRREYDEALVAMRQKMEKDPL